jgi:threonine/homoserine/homoserine lactone efflux protein
MTTPLFAGLGFGFLVAAQVGPVWLLAARSVILGRLVSGIMIGLGAATIDVCYGALGLAGAASLLRIPGLRRGLGLLGAAVLIALGAMALRHVTRAGEQAAPPALISSASRAYLTALGVTAANPLTIASWAAVFAAAATARITDTTDGAVLVLAGIGLGTATWFTVLSTAVALVRRLAGRRVLRAVNVFSGLGLVAFGLVLAWQSAATSSP